MSKYRIIVLTSEGAEEKINELAAEGYAIAHVVQPATATSPCTFFRPTVIMEKKIATDALSP